MHLLYLGGDSVGGSKDSQNTVTFDPAMLNSLICRTISETCIQRQPVMRIRIKIGFSFGYERGFYV
jgi:hypothetical protein